MIIILYAAVRRTSMICTYLSCISAAALCVVILLLLQLQCCCLLLLAAACCCCSSLCAGRRNLLLWFIASDPSVLFLFIQTRFFLMYLLTVLSHAQLRFTYNNPKIHTRYHTSSKFTGMRGANAGGSSPRRSLPCRYMYSCVAHECLSNRWVRCRLAFEP